MTYSNINRDRLQMGKNLAGIVFFLLIVVNIVKQMNILTIAKGKNLEMKNRLTILEIENRKLKQQVEYATSSAFIEQQTRDKFGLGNENDAWLILPEEKDYNLGISLFTR